VSSGFLPKKTEILLLTTTNLDAPYFAQENLCGTTSRIKAWHGAQEVVVKCRNRAWKNEYSAGAAAISAAAGLRCQSLQMVSFAGLLFL